MTKRSFFQTASMAALMALSGVATADGVRIPPPGSSDMPSLQNGQFVLRRMTDPAESARPQPVQPCDVLTLLTIWVKQTPTPTYNVSFQDSYAGTCGGAPALNSTPRTYVLTRDSRFPFPCGVAYVSNQIIDSQAGMFPALTLQDYRSAPNNCREPDASGNPGITADLVANEWSDDGMIQWALYPAGLAPETPAN